jgi:hypothetical protein
MVRCNDGICVLEERRPHLEDVQVFVIQVLRIRVPEMRRKHDGRTRVMVLGQPHGKDVELLVAGKHGVERGHVFQSFFHHLSRA